MMIKVQLVPHVEEVMADPVDIVLSVIAIAVKVKTCCDTVKANKNQCKILGDRISILASQVEKIPHKAILSKAEGLQQLQRVLESALEFVSQYTKDQVGFLPGLKRLVRSSDDSEQFREIYERLTQASSDLFWTADTTCVDR